MKAFFRYLVVLWWLPALPWAAAAAVIHVNDRSPAARDTNSGDSDAPLKTISEALKRVRPGQTIRIAAGDYREQLNLGVSGTAEEPIVIEAASDQRVVINGADPVRKWLQVTNRQAQPETSMEVWAAELNWRPEMVFVEGRLAVAAAPSLIPRNPGEYVLEGTRPPYRLLLGAAKGNSPENLKIEASRRQSGVSANGVSFITLRGIEVSGVQGSGINFSAGSNNLIEGCIVHHCRIDPEKRAAFGISFGAQTGSRIRHCISVRNSYGISISGSSNCLIEENISGAHTVDAFLITWKSRSITLRRNYAFDNWADRHPDGLQTYRDVSNLRLDSNVFLNVGQGWQCQETQNAVVTNNIWAGIHWGYSISCSLRHSTIGITNLNNSFHNNTFFGGMVLSGGSSRFTHNIVIPPSLGGCPGGPPIESDFNLIWSDLPYYFRWTARDGKAAKSSNFRDYQKANGDNQHSTFALPSFRNAPVLYRQLFQKRGSADVKPEKDRLYVGDTTGFAVKDWIEVDCDGVARQITSLKGGYATVSPPCTTMPRGSLSFLWNWKKNPDFRLDLRLEPGKSGVKTTPGREVGSNVNIQDYMRGDFDGNGTSEVPKLPADLLKGHPLLQLDRWES